MSLEKAKDHLAKFGKADAVMEFDTSSATVELAAAAVGCEADREDPLLRHRRPRCPGGVRGRRPHRQPEIQGAIRHEAEDAEPR